MDSTADVIIMGGGIIGASIAYHLRRDDPGIGRVVVIEQDWTYTRAAAPMSMGGIRQQYSAACNVALARYSLPFMSSSITSWQGLGASPRRIFTNGAISCLMHAENQDRLRQKYEVQRDLGVEIELLSPEAIRDFLPHFNVDDIAGGLYGPRDGYLNPRGALQGFVEQSRELGCVWLQDEVLDFQPGDARATVRTRHHGTLSTPQLVIAAGAWTQRLAALADIDLPVQPVRRQGCYVTLPAQVGYKFPMILDRTRDMSFRHDTETDNHLLMSRTLRDEPPGFNFDWDIDAFEREMRPMMRHYLPD